MFKKLILCILVVFITASFGVEGKILGTAVWDYGDKAIIKLENGLCYWLDVSTPRGKAAYALILSIYNSNPSQAVYLDVTTETILGFGQDMPKIDNVLVNMS